MGTWAEFTRMCNGVCLPGEQKEGEQAQGRLFPGEYFANPVHWDFEAP